MYEDDPGLEQRLSRFEAQLTALKAAYQTKNSVAVKEYADKVNRSRLASADQLALANFYIGKIDYDKGDGASHFKYDVLTQGPVGGFVFRF